MKKKFFHKYHKYNVLYDLGLDHLNISDFSLKFLIAPWPSYYLLFDNTSHIYITANMLHIHNMHILKSNNK